jgi:hypothetical protein
MQSPSGCEVLSACCTQVRGCLRASCLRVPNPNDSLSPKLVSLSLLGRGVGCSELGFGLVLSISPPPGQFRSRKINPVEWYNFPWPG